MPPEPLDEARAALLRALEQLDRARDELDGEPERVDLCVIYSAGRIDPDDGSWIEVTGWSSTAGPKWVHAALLDRSAEALTNAVIAADDDESG